MNMEQTLSSVVESVAKEVGADSLPTIDADTNLMDYFDSLGLLNIVMSTESELESELGRYIMLADETLMDATASPFLKFGNWCAYVQNAIDRG